MFNTTYWQDSGYNSGTTDSTTACKRSSKKKQNSNATNRNTSSNYNASNSNTNPNINGTNYNSNAIVPSSQSQLVNGQYVPVNSNPINTNSKDYINGLMAGIFDEYLKKAPIITQPVVAPPIVTQAAANVPYQSTLPQPISASCPVANTSVVAFSLKELILLLVFIVIIVLLVMILMKTFK